MQEEDFRQYLKRKGKKQNVIERNIFTIRRIGSYLEKEFKINIQTISSKKIDSIVKTLEENGESAKGPLYVLMNYFRFTGDHALLTHAAELRAERTNKTRKAFKLKEFLDINQKHVETLADIGIDNFDQMLQNGKTRQQRKQLTEKLQIPEEVILELVNLSDLTRIGHVKAKLTRLYYDAGFKSPKDVAAYEPEKLHEHFKKYITQTGYDGMIPNLKDLVHNVNNARKLPQIVEE